MKRKIVFFMANLIGGGAERVTVNIIKQLDKNRFDIFLVMVSREGIFLKEIPTYVKIINLNAKKTLFSIFKFRKIIQNIQPDIIYSTMTHTSIAQYLALLGIKDKPFIVLRNATSPKLLAQEGRHKRSWKFLFKRAYKTADRVLAQTPEMKNELIEYYGLSPKRVDIFINPLNEDEINNKINNVQNPFNQDKINVVAAGRLTYAKAFDVLLDAFALVIKKDKNFVLHIIGRDDGERELLLKKQKELNLEKNVNFLGFQSNPYRFFYFSDLFVLSSRREGLPNALLENLYLKKPVVSTRCIPFISTLIENGRNGFLTDIEDSKELASKILDFKKLQNLGFTQKYQPTNSNRYFQELREEYA